MTGPACHESDLTLGPEPRITGYKPTCRDQCGRCQLQQQPEAEMLTNSKRSSVWPLSRAYQIYHSPPTRCALGVPNVGPSPIELPRMILTRKGELGRLSSRLFLESRWDMINVESTTPCGTNRIKARRPIRPRRRRKEWRQGGLQLCPKIFLHNG